MKTPPPAAPAAGPPTWPPSAPPSSRPSKTPATCTSPKAGATTPPQPKPSTFTASIKTETDIHGTRRSPEVQAGAGEEAFEERGPVLHPFEPGLDQGGQLGEVAFGQVGQGALEV